MLKKFGRAFSKITEENQKDLLSSKIYIIQIMYLAVPKHDVHVIIFNISG